MRHSAWSLVVIAFLAGCVEVSLRVVQKIPLQQPKERIYVVVHEGAAPPFYARALAQAMVTRLGAHAGAFKSAVLTGVEFDTSFLDRDIDAFRAHAVLQIKPIGTHSDRYGNTSRVTYSATLFDSPSKKGLWAAKVEAPAYAQPRSPARPPNASSGDSAGAWAADRSAAVSTMHSAMEAAAEKIVAAMAADQMIGPAVVAYQL
jgi:hypothetical protein